jgi:hypothetical protein
MAASSAASSSDACRNLLYCGVSRQTSSDGCSCEAWQWYLPFASDPGYCVARSMGVACTFRLTELAVATRAPSHPTMCISPGLSAGPAGCCQLLPSEALQAAARPATPGGAVRAIWCWALTPDCQAGGRVS